jgi:hypothetical protein
MNNFFKKNPFFWTGALFAVISILFHQIGLEKTTIGMIVYFIPIHIFIAWVIYFPIKYFIDIKKGRERKISSWISWIVLAIILPLMGYLSYIYM